MAYDSPEFFTRRSGAAVYGVAVDGDLVFAGGLVTYAGVTIAHVGNVYTLPTDIYANRVTISAPYTVRPQGNRICCWELLGDGTIEDSGNDAVGNVAGAALVASTGSTLRSSLVGATGRTTVGNGANGGPATSSLSSGLAGSGGATGIRTGGTGGLSSNSIAMRLDSYYMLIKGTLDTFPVQGGAGGGAGGLNTAGAGAYSGAGGGGGGIVFVNAALWDFTGTIRARGGNGGAAALSDGGGGGGGGGGAAYLVIRQIVRPANFELEGGLGGAGVGGGANGTQGNVGTAVLVQGP